MENIENTENTEQQTKKPRNKKAPWRTTVKDDGTIS